MNITETDLPGVLILEPRRFGDARGWFMESWNRETLFKFRKELHPAHLKKVLMM